MPGHADSVILSEVGMLQIYVTLSHAFGELKEDIEGNSLVEYALFVALIGFVVIVALNSLINDIGNAFNSVGEDIRGAARKSGGSPS